MFSVALNERLETLIDDLIMDGGLEAASLVTILLAAKDSIERADHVLLSRKVWTANDELMTAFGGRPDANPNEATSTNTSLSHGA